MTWIAVTCLHLQRHFEKFRFLLETHGVDVVLPKVNGQRLDTAEIRRTLPGMTAIIAGDDVIDREALTAAKQKGLKAVIKWGIGTDSIDTIAARELEIPVFNTPGVFGDEVADLALTYLLLLTRGLHRMDRSIRNGDWLKIEGRSLHGMTAGVVGLGSIGRAIACRCTAFGMKVIGCDSTQIDKALLSQSSVDQVPFEDVLSGADVVLLACALTVENRHMMNQAAFARMKPASYFVNVARGPLVDETALAEALARGNLAGAGLDVFETEPLPADSPLRSFDNCVFGTHNGSNTHDAVDRVNRMTIEIVLDVLGFEKAPFLPNRVA